MREFLICEGKKMRKTNQSSKRMTVEHVRLAAQAHRHRAAILWALEMELEGSFGRNASPVRLLRIDDALEEPRRDVIDEIRSELLVARSVASRESRELLSRPVDGCGFQTEAPTFDRARFGRARTKRPAGG
jgi:hypothetical protein